jgi:deazaflavin-dependent oxidoreductase (nitroreductase family)
VASETRRTLQLTARRPPNSTNWRDPGWYHNLKANPAARVTIKGDAWDATARLATPGEREELWANGVELYPGLTKERAWAGERQIEAFVLNRPLGALWWRLRLATHAVADALRVCFAAGRPTS